MKKRIIILFLSLILILPSVLPISASAAPDSPATPKSAYYLDNTLFSFVAPKNDAEFSKAKVYLEVDNTLHEAKSSPQRLTNTDTRVSYLLLVDASNSMQKYSKRVQNIADALVNSEQQEISVSVATFGKEFCVVKEDITNINVALETLAGIKYTQNASEICDGLLDAIAYLKTKTPKAGELVNIVLITDGDMYMSKTGRSQSAIQQVANSTKTTIEDISELVIHTVCFGEWNSTTYDAVSVGSGLDLTANNNSEATKAGNEIASFIDGLFRVDVSYHHNDYSKRFNAKLITAPPDSSYIDDTYAVQLNSVRNMNVEDSITVPMFDEGGNLIPRENDNNGVDVTEPTEEEAEGDTTNDIQDTSEQPSESATSSELDSQTPNPKNRKLIISIVVAAVVILIAVFAIIAKKSSNRKSAKKASGHSIVIKLEIIYGNCQNKDDELKLFDELYIGSSNDCDLIFKDENIAAKNTRIYLNDGVVYIEDLNEVSNTYLGGMKIYSPNRLRSGDEITIGNTSFCLRF